MKPGIVVLALALVACDRGRAPEPEPAAPRATAPVSPPASGEHAAPPVPTGSPPPSASATGGSPPASASSATAVSRDAATSVVGALTELAAIHTANETDCAKLAKALAVFHGRRGAELAATPPAVYAFIEADPALSKELARAMEKIDHATKQCSANADFEKFRESLRTKE